MRSALLLLTLAAAAHAFWWPLARRESVCSTVTPTSYIGLDSSVLGSTADVVTVDTAATPLCPLTRTDPITRSGVPRGVWHVFRGTGESVSLSTSSPNTNFNTALHLFACGGENTRCAAYNDDCGGETAAALSFVSDADTVYYVLVTGFQYATDMYELSLASSGSACAVELNGESAGALSGWLGSFNNDNYGGWTSLTGTKVTTKGSFAGSMASGSFAGSFAGSFTNHKTSGFTHIANQTTKSPFAGTAYPYATTNYPYATTGQFHPSSSGSSSSTSLLTPCEAGVHATPATLGEIFHRNSANGIPRPKNLIRCDGTYGYEEKGFWFKYKGSGEWVTATTAKKDTTIKTSVHVYMCDSSSGSNCDGYNSGGCEGQAAEQFMAEEGTEYYIFVANEINSYNEGTIEFQIRKGYHSCGSSSSSTSSSVRWN